MIIGLFLVHKEPIFRQSALLLGSIIFITACSSGQAVKTRITGPVLQISGVEIHNALPYSVQDVIILAPATGDFVSCGQILPESSCSTSFPARDYRENPLQVKWKEYGQLHSTSEFKLAAPQSARDGQSAYIRVDVFAAGEAGATLVLLETDST